MNSEIKEYCLQNNPHQKIQIVTADSFDDLNFVQPSFDEESFDKLRDLYVDYIVKKYRAIFGTIILFYLPDNFNVDVDEDYKEYGHIYDSLTKYALYFKKHIHLKNKKLFFDNEKVRSIYDKLKQSNCLVCAKGNRNYLTILPVGKHFGFLSKTKIESKVRVNANFFVMDMFDCGSVYDRISTPIGLCVKNGVIINPPSFDREVLISKNNDVSISKISLNDLTILIDGVEYHHNENAQFYTRPQNKKTPSGGFDVVIVKDKVIAIKEDGNTVIPSGGFVLHLNKKINIDSLDVKYDGLKDVDFAIQVGNSAIVNNVVTKRFISPFYNFLNLFSISYPPSMYPLNYKKDRAPRIVLGADQENKPMIIWFEGAAKFGHNPSADSCGVSLKEVADICKDLRMKNGINLDGGGSAQIIYDNQRYLKISDRKKESFSENERAVPMGLYII